MQCKVQLTEPKRWKNFFNLIAEFAMKTIVFVVTTLIQLYIFVLLLRVWMQCVRADFYNPFSKFVVKATQPIVGRYVE